MTQRLIMTRSAQAHHHPSHSLRLRLNLPPLAITTTNPCPSLHCRSVLNFPNQSQKPRLRPSTVSLRSPSPIEALPPALVVFSPSSKIPALAEDSTPITFTPPKARLRPTIMPGSPSPIEPLSPLVLRRSPYVSSFEQASAEDTPCKHAKPYRTRNISRPNHTSALCSRRNRRAPSIDLTQLQAYRLNHHTSKPVISYHGTDLPAYSTTLRIAYRLTSPRRTTKPRLCPATPPSPIYILRRRISGLSCNPTSPRSPDTACNNHITRR